MSSDRLLGLSLDDLQELLIRIGSPSYRAAQIWHGIYKELVSSYAEITTLPQPLRKRLETLLPWPSLETVDSLQSSDHQTTKLLLALEDGETIETVHMRYESRNTVCVSTQVGCAMNCRFCATGRSGFRRDLNAGEIVAQVLATARILHHEGQRLTNIVYMGMGEPLANYDATLQSIRILNDSRGFSLGARSFTISTVGLIPEIKRLATEPLQINLAVSLHTANDELRSWLVPANLQHPVARLIHACEAYTEATRRRITFEIALIEGVNDSDAHAQEVAHALRGLLCHVNLIPFNPVHGSTWASSAHDRVTAYAATLEAAGIPTTIRLGRGRDIQAGCGQLRSRREQE
jgi:23S rRNA (adenine2503-C2)-methyltransferase